MPLLRSCSSAALRDACAAATLLSAKGSRLPRCGPASFRHLPFAGSFATGAMAWRALATGTVSPFRNAALRTRAPLSRCCSSRGTDSERDFALRGVHADHREVVSRALELAAGASERWSVAQTEFVEPPVAADIALAVGRLADCEARPYGGYEHAERVRMRCGRPDLLDAEPPEGAVAVVSVEGASPHHVLCAAAC